MRSLAKMTVLTLKNFKNRMEIATSNLVEAGSEGTISVIETSNSTNIDENSIKTPQKSDQDLLNVLFQFNEIKTHHPQLVESFDKVSSKIDTEKFFDFKLFVFFIMDAFDHFEKDQTYVQEYIENNFQGNMVLRQIWKEFESNEEKTILTKLGGLFSFSKSASLQKECYERAKRKATDCTTMDFLRNDLFKRSSIAIKSFVRAEFDAYWKGILSIWSKEVEKYFRKMDKAKSNQLKRNWEASIVTLGQDHVGLIKNFLEAKYSRNRVYCIESCREEHHYSFDRCDKIVIMGYKEFQPSNVIEARCHFTDLDRGEIQQLEDVGPSYVPQLIKNHSIKVFLLAENSILLKMFQLKSKKLLILIKSGNDILAFLESASNQKTCLNEEKCIIRFKQDIISFDFDDHKSLFAVFTKDFKLNVYKIDDDLNRLLPMFLNIDINIWYNNENLQLSQIVFFRGNDEICFVEKNGRTRCFNLITSQFRASSVNFPANSKVISSPDGSCLLGILADFDKGGDEVAEFVGTDNDFVCETLADEIMEGIESTPLVEGNALPRDDSLMNEKAVLVHVAYHDDFGKPILKIVKLIGATEDAIESLSFSSIAGKLDHLHWINSSGLLVSNCVDITIEKSEWQLQNEAITRKGKVDVKSNVVTGAGTSFLKSAKVGDIIVVGGESRTIECIENNEMLITESSFSFAGSYMDFSIRPKTSSNNFIDCYSLGFEKFAIVSCLEDAWNPNSQSNGRLTIVVDEESAVLTEGDYLSKFRLYVSNLFRKLKESTQKNITILDDFYIGLADVSSFSSEYCGLECSSKSVCDLLVTLSCLIPIQISIASQNRFIPLKDGIMHSGIEQLEINEIANAISFGWYESIFNLYANAKIQVVSSLGEQSVGKSYFLNSFVGTHFEGNAMRCTEGCWMSLFPSVNRKGEKILIVALDFEGLRSVERSLQEETFLTLFNAAISNLILFKTNFSIGRDLTQMFSRFQDSSNLFDPKSNPRLFNSALCVIVKDVATRDRDAISKEFQSKFMQIVRDEQGKNFISQLHNGLHVVPWPMFASAGFYNSFKIPLSFLEKQEVKYRNVLMWKEEVKLLMAKLFACDWSSIDSNIIQMRRRTLLSVMENVVQFGLENTTPYRQTLQSLDDGNEIDDYPIRFDDVKKEYVVDFHQENIEVEDNLRFDSGFELVLKDRDISVILDIFTSRQSSNESEQQWFGLFSNFLAVLLERRVARATEWLEVNISRFPKDNNDISFVLDHFEEKIQTLRRNWSLCSCSCANCKLTCLLPVNHVEQHTCFTNHRCSKECKYSDEHEEDDFTTCQLMAGHDGAHLCDAAKHLCGEPCLLIAKRNCQSQCTLLSGHADEEHLCSSKVHYCGEACGLNGIAVGKTTFDCPNLCIIPYEEQHDLHKCENQLACPLSCPFDNCQNKCCSKDHFHAFESDVVHHHCGKEHRCEQLCECDGICDIQTQPISSQDVYQNNHTSFAYTKYIQTSRRLQCSSLIPAFQFSHPGVHSHSSADMAFHFCDVKCPYCSYYCHLPKDHPQPLHQTAHGNAIQAQFSCVDDEFEYAGYKFNSGDSAKPYLCNMFCKKLDRHFHIDYCENEDDPSICENKGKVHLTCKIDPNLDVMKDKITHAHYWSKIQFEDPYTVQEQTEFQKCDFECQDPCHLTGTSPQRSFCTLAMFHKPLTGPLPNGIGYISSNGHHFECKNPANGLGGPYHIVFVIDQSYSMGTPYNFVSGGSPRAAAIATTHPNALGATYDSIYRFLEARRTINVSGLQDSFSMVLFESSSRVAFENCQGKSNVDILNSALAYHPGGGTDMHAGIAATQAVIERNWSSNMTPVVVLLSDGDVYNPAQAISAMASLCQKCDSLGKPLHLHSIYFGGGATHPTLVDVTNVAKGFLPAGSNSAKYYQAKDEVMLSEHFVELAVSLQLQKPTLMRM